MCLGFPAQVIEVDEMSAVIELEGERRRVSTLLQPDVVVGDHVFVAGRSIVGRLDAEEAAEVHRLLLEVSALDTPSGAMVEGHGRFGPSVSSSGEPRSAERM